MKAEKKGGPTVDPETLTVVQKVVDEWFADEHRDHPERYTTESYNAAHEAKEDLKRRIAALETK